MFTSKPRSINGLFLLAAVVGLVFGSAGPAAAGHSLTIAGGSTSSNGEEWGPSLTELCSDNNNQFTGAEFPSTYYLITENAHSFVVYETGNPVVYYNGPLSMNIQHGEAVFGPQGARPGPCVQGQEFTPEPVPLTKASMTGSSGTGSVNCATLPGDENDGAGTYNRVESDVTFVMNLSCTVRGNVSPYSSVGRAVWTKFTVSGTQNTSGYLKIAGTTMALSGNGH